MHLSFIITRQVDTFPSSPRATSECQLSSPGSCMVARTTTGEEADWRSAIVAFLSVHLCSIFGLTSASPAPANCRQNTMFVPLHQSQPDLAKPASCGKKNPGLLDLFKANGYYAILGEAHHGRAQFS
eukprot:TRINITY_DN4375_c2_g1_i1.p1 TRINITY_DN4375_c2_g1~~TRINITY_DN4375_c2_g1_i1.p1  ORF type:complete len:127 (-),score=1.86 TRINITY_DN4375_c2_g1_i1:232-612(-)